MAMVAEKADRAADSPARTLLLNQNRLVLLQIASERAGLALKMLTAAAGVVVALILAVMVWEASRAEGLVIRPFATPPALAQRGVTGEALASQLLDNLDRIAGASRTPEARQRISADQGGGISIEIPQTGVSIGQLEQWLRERLGRQRPITGELMTDPDGSLTMVTRIGSTALPPQSGAAPDIPTMLTRAAEAIVERERPRTYGSYLLQAGRYEDMLAWLRPRTEDPDAAVRAQSWAGIGNALRPVEGDAAAADAFRRALAIDPRANTAVAGNLGDIERLRGHSEAAFQLERLALRVLADAKDRTPAAREFLILSIQGRLAAAQGDHALALTRAQAVARTAADGYTLPVRVLALFVPPSQVAVHDLSAAARSLADSEDDDSRFAALRINAQVQLHLAREDWAAALADSARWTASYASLPDEGRDRWLHRLPAVSALLGAGRVAEAQAWLAETPLDCQPCVIQRGIAAAKAGDPRAADHWFSEAVRMAPSLPQADYEWARVLLDRRDPDAALRRLAEAVRKGPRYADAIELRGEALLTKGDARTAAAMFAEAAKLAPRWGRLHLKWGEALANLGKADEARAKWRAAATMDLSPADRAALRAHGV